MVTESELNELRTVARAIRHDIVDMIGYENGKVGHLGGSCSIAEIMAALYFYKANVSPEAPKMKDRDRVVLSKGHAALAQYAALAEKGFYPKEQLYSVKKLGAMLQGHPDMTKTPGIEANTGSLGQGLSIGLGMALGQRMNELDSKVYVVMGDGEQAEGQIWEAAMAAANFGTDNLIGILDNNLVQATGTIKDRMDSGDLGAKWKAFGWDVFEIDGHNLEAICDALDMCDEANGRPKLILAHTIKGKGVFFAEGNASFHNGALTKEQYQQAHADIDTAMAR